MILLKILGAWILQILLCLALVAFASAIAYVTKWLFGSTEAGAILGTLAVFALVVWYSWGNKDVERASNYFP